jgi:hypothetical protein
MTGLPDPRLNAANPTARAQPLILSSQQTMDHRAP